MKRKIKVAIVRPLVITGVIVLIAHLVYWPGELASARRAEFAKSQSELRQLSLVLSMELQRPAPFQLESLQRPAPFQQLESFDDFRAIMQEVGYAAPYGDGASGVDNPFPGWLSGKRYGWLVAFSNGIDAEAPLIWDWGRSCRGKVPVLFLSGRVDALGTKEVAEFCTQHEDKVHIPR